MTEILKSLQVVNEELGSIAKSQQGHNYKFRGIDQVLNSLSPLFKKHGVLVGRRNLESERTVRDVTGKYGVKQYVETFIKRCDYVFTSTKDGSEFISQGFGEGQDSSGGDKSASMATSNAYKYVIFEMFSIATEEQKDSDQRTAEKEERERAAEAKKQAAGKAPQQKNPLLAAIRERIGSATGGFKDTARLAEIYKALGVTDPKQIPLADPAKQRDWLDYLKGLSK